MLNPYSQKTSLNNTNQNFTSNFLDDSNTEKPKKNTLKITPGPIKSGSTNIT